MTHKKGSSLLDTRRENRILIKNLIFRTENATRTAVAEELGLTLPTITTSVNEMLAEGILEEIAISENQLINNIGRRPTAIAFRASAAYAIGIELGPYATRGVLTNLKGEVIRSIVTNTGEEDYYSMRRQLVDIYRKLSDSVDKELILGVGVGLPGFIEHDKGIIRSNPRKEWIGRHLASDLSKDIGVAVSIDNNVRIRAIGYEMSLKGKRPDSFTYFYVSNGVACPMLIKGDVFSGYTAGAGEIGHTTVFVGENGEEKVIDDLGSEKAILKECKKVIEKKKISGIDVKSLKIEDVLELQLKGNKEINDIVVSAIKYLGISLSNVVNLMNPGYVVVDGYIFMAEENRKLLLEEAKRRFFGLNEGEVQMIFADFDRSSGAIGAAFLAIRDMFLDL